MWRYVLLPIRPCRITCDGGPAYNTDTVSAPAAMLVRRFLAAGDEHDSTQWAVDGRGSRTGRAGGAADGVGARKRRHWYWCAGRACVCGAGSGLLPTAAAGVLSAAAPRLLRRAGTRVLWPAACRGGPGLVSLGSALSLLRWLPLASLALSPISHEKAPSGAFFFACAQRANTAQQGTAFASNCRTGRRCRCAPATKRRGAERRQGLPGRYVIRVKRVRIRAPAQARVMFAVQ